MDHSLHLERRSEDGRLVGGDKSEQQELDKTVRLDSDKKMLSQLWWLLPLVFLKPLMTSITLGGGGSGGIFAPSLFLGATLGGCFGIVCNLLFPGVSANPGVYAIVGMGAVVAGTTHGILSAVLIVYKDGPTHQIHRQITEFLKVMPQRPKDRPTPKLGLCRPADGTMPPGLHLTEMREFSYGEDCAADCARRFAEGL